MNSLVFVQQFAICECIGAIIPFDILILVGFCKQVRGSRLRDSFEVAALKPCVLTVVEGRNYSPLGCVGAFPVHF